MLHPPRAFVQPGMLPIALCCAIGALLTWGGCATNIPAANAPTNLETWATLDNLTLTLTSYNTGTLIPYNNARLDGLNAFQAQNSSFKLTTGTYLIVGELTVAAPAWNSGDFCRLVFQTSNLGTIGGNSQLMPSSAQSTAGNAECTVQLTTVLTVQGTSDTLQALGICSNAQAQTNAAVNNPYNYIMITKEL